MCVCDAQISMSGMYFLTNYHNMQGDETKEGEDDEDFFLLQT